MGETIKQFEIALVIPEKSPLSVANAENIVVERTILDQLRICLKLSVRLLTNSFNKEVYTSTEHLFFLLRAYDEEIGLLAVEALCALASPPTTHKCIDSSRHSTVLHKTPTLCQPLFALIESVYFSLSAEKLLTEDFEFKPSYDEISVQLSQLAIYKDLYQNEGGVWDTFRDMDSVQLEATFSIPSLSRDNRPMWELLKPLDATVQFSEGSETANAAANAAHVSRTSTALKQKFYFLWHIRGKRWLASLAGRVKLSLVLNQCVLALLCCYNDSTLLSKFFQDKPDLLQDFVFFIKTGPNSPVYPSLHSIIPNQLRTVACNSLTAVIGSRESSSSSVLAVLGRFSWLQQDLGINRSQYMGLLPCLVRMAMSGLSELHATLPEMDVTVVDSTQSKHASTASSSSAKVASSGNEMAVDTNVDDDEKQRALMEYVTSPRYEDLVDWTEALLTFILSLITMTNSALLTLTETGCIQSLLAMLNVHPSIYHSPRRVYLDSLVLQILDTAIGNNEQTLHVFMEAKGGEIIASRIHAQLSFFLTSDGSLTEIPYAHQIVLMQLVNLLISFFNDERAVGSGGQLRQSTMARSACLHTIFDLVASNSRSCQALVVNSVMTMFIDLINGDPSPPGVLNHFLSNVNGQDSLVGKMLDIVKILDVPDEKSALVVDSSFVPTFTSLISSVALTQAGIVEVTERNSVIRLFNVFVNSTFYRGNSNLFKNDLASIIGTNLEELVRHYPNLQDNCVSNVTSVLLWVIDVFESTHGNQLTLCPNTSWKLAKVKYADKLESVYNNMRTFLPPPLSPVVDTDADLVGNHVPLLHFSTTALVTMESLLMRKQTAAQFLSIGGFFILLAAHDVALGPFRYLIASLQCAISPTNFSIGHSPLVAVIARCMNLLWEADPESYLNTLLECLNATVTTLKANIVEFYKHSTNAAVGRKLTQITETLTGSNGSIENLSFELLLESFLECIPSKPMYECYGSDGWNMNDDMVYAASVLKSLSEVDFLVYLLATALKNSTLASGSSELMKVCFNVLKKSENTDLISTVVKSLFVSTQVEIARSKEATSVGMTMQPPKAHPIYRVLVTVRDSLPVREGPDDTAKRVCKYERGTVVLAYERFNNAAGITKYRTADGWISQLRSSTATELQLEIIDVFSKPADIAAQEIATYEVESKSWATMKKFNYEKLLNISGYRSGLMSFYHLNISVRNLFLGLSRTMYYTDRPSHLPPSNLSLKVGEHAPKVVSILMDVLDSLCQSDLPDTTAEIETDENTTQFSFPRTLEKLRLLKENTEEAFDVNFSFVPAVIPKMSVFGCQSRYLHTSLIEIVFTILFDEKGRQRSETNHVCIINSFYTNNILERVINSSRLTFLSCLQNKIWLQDVGAEADVSTCIKEIDDEFVARFDDADGTAPSSWSCFYEDSSSSLTMNMSNRRKKALRAWVDRKTFALSSLDPIIELWKQLFTICGAGPSPANMEVQLTELASEGRHFDLFVFRRSLLTLLIRYLFPVLSHELVYSLPPPLCRNVLDLLNLAMKTLQDTKDLRMTYPGPSQPTENSHGGASTSQARRTYRMIGSDPRLQAAPTAPRSFRPNDSVIESLVGMGFSRSQVLAAMNALQNNDVSMLTDALLTNQFPVVAAPAASSASSTSQATSLASPPASSTEEAAVEAANPSTSTADSSADAAVAVQNENILVEGANTNLIVVTGSSSDSPTDGQKEAARLLVPFIPKQPIEDSKKVKKLNQAIFVTVLASLKSIYLNLIENLRAGSGIFWDPISSTLDRTMNRDYAMSMLYSYLFKSLASFQWLDNGPRCAVIGWLFNRALELVLENGATPSIDTSYRLTGILHMCVLVLNEKISPQSATASSRQAKDLTLNEFLLVFVTRDVRYNLLFPLLIEHMEQVLGRDELWSTRNLVLTENERRNRDGDDTTTVPLSGTSTGSSSSMNGPSTSASDNDAAISGVDSVSESIFISPEVAWVVPALLLLDLVGQAHLISTMGIADGCRRLLGELPIREPAVAYTYTIPLIELGFIDLPMTEPLMMDLDEEFGLPVNLFFHFKPSLDALRSISYQRVLDILKPRFFSLSEFEEFQTKFTSVTIWSSEKKAFIYSLFSRKRISLTTIPVVEPAKVAATLTEAPPAAKKKRGRPPKRKQEETEQEPVPLPVPVTAPEPAVAPASESSCAQKPASLYEDDVLPLNSLGLPLHLKLKCAEIGQECVKRIKALQAVVFDSDSTTDLNNTGQKVLSAQQTQLLKTFVASLAQASLQLLVHMTREAKVREHFFRLSGAASLLSLRQMFEGMSSVVFTLLQHQLEEPQYLQSTMETTIRLCWTRMQSQNSAARLKLQLLLEVVAPLLYRNPTVFVQALANVCQISLEDLSGSDSNPVVTLSNEPRKDLSPTKRLVFPLKDESTTAVSGADMSTAMDVQDSALHSQSMDSKASDADNNVATPATKRARISSADSTDAVGAVTASSAANTPVVASDGTPFRAASSAIRSPINTALKSTRKPKSEPTSPLAHSSNSNSMQGVVEKLLASIVYKYMIAKQGDIFPPMALKAIMESTVAMPISELLTTVADIISSMASLGSFVHRFHLNKCGIHLSASNSAAVRNAVSHVITGETLWPCSFVTFLIHCLTLSNLDTIALKEDCTGAPDKKVEQDRMKQLLGDQTHPASVYLFSAIASRNGEGRRRILTEFLGVFKSKPNQPFVELNSTSQLLAASRFADTIYQLIAPPPTWNSRDTFIIPARDIFSILTSLKCQSILGNVLCRINLEHPYSQRALEKVALPLELMMRKGASGTGECQPLDQEFEQWVSNIESLRHETPSPKPLALLPSDTLSPVGTNAVATPVSNAATLGLVTPATQAADSRGRTRTITSTVVSEELDRADGGRHMETEHQHLISSVDPDETFPSHGDEDSSDGDDDDNEEEDDDDMDEDDVSV